MKKFDYSSYGIYEEIDKYERYSDGSSEQNFNQSFDNDNSAVDYDTSNSIFSINTDQSDAQLETSWFNLNPLSPSFYFKNLNRNQSEALLCGHEDGVFLVRDSVYFKGELTLSFVLNTDQFDHYIIHKSKLTNKFTIDKKNWFTTVNDLIKFYQLYENNLSVKCLTIGLSSNNIALESKLTLNKKFVISISDLKFDQFVGSGEFANVRKGEWKGKTVAIKLYKDSDFSVQNIFVEADIMNCLDHENILKLHGISIICKVMLITEYMPNGNLLNYLRSRGRNLIGPDELLNYTKQVICAFDYLESRQIIHRDLCASNVLLDAGRTARISDFGLAISHRSNKLISEHEYPTKLRIKWTAIECLHGRNFSSKSDVWSFGVLLWEIFSYGKIPYPKVSTSALEQYLCSGERMSPPENTPLFLAQIMNSCWKINYNERPSFNQLKKELVL